MNIIIVAPHFPPSALPPSQRVRLLLPHLANMNIEVTIFSTYQKYREEIADPWMVELAGKDYNLIQVRSFSQKLTRWFGIGDLGLRMLPFLFFRLRRYIKRNQVDFILYPVPPWYVLLIAPLIKKISTVPYGIDFIDPWVEGGVLPENATLKRKLSQWLAQRSELYVCNHASIIYAVSDGILKQLKERHKRNLQDKPMIAIPYGAESSDFQFDKYGEEKRSYCLVRYIGAVWDDAYPVIKTILHAFSLLNVDFKLEFYGTSYLGKGMAEPQLSGWIKEFELQSSTSEVPDRVPYREAVRLSVESDILMLFGGMQSYYAASKLFGLIVSKKPFFAFLHKDSFPAKILRSVNFKYLVEYSESPNDLPHLQLNRLKEVIRLLIDEYNNFTPVDSSNSEIRKYTAEGMTRAFVEPINKYLDERL